MVNGPQPGRVWSFKSAWSPKGWVDPPARVAQVWTSVHWEHGPDRPAGVVATTSRIEGLRWRGFTRRSWRE
jgi:hypothetical protein